MKTEKIGFGVERTSFTLAEVRRMHELMEVTGGSIFDAIRAFTRGKNLNQDEVVRLIYIAENRMRLIKSFEDAELGKRCEVYEYKK